MKILFRVDGYQKIGLGHLVRCNAIAENLLERDNNTEIIFLSKLDDFSKQIIKNEYFQVINPETNENEEDYILRHVNQTSADKLFIDNVYNYQPRFITNLRKKTQVILFHYFSPACFFADKYILPSAHSSDEIIKDELWNKYDVQFFSGSAFVIINKEIQEIQRIRNEIRPVRSRMKLIITTGGSDPKGILLKIVKWLSDPFVDDIDICILKGQAFMHNSKLSKLINSLPSTVQVVDYNKNELVDADVAVCTFGVSTYELMYLGIPILSIGHAIPNAQGSRLLQERYNALVDLGIIEELDKATFVSSLKLLLSSSLLRNALSTNSKLIVDGKGLDRVTDAIIA